MKVIRFAALSAVCFSTLIIGACGKESPPPATKTETAPAAPVPSTPAPAAPSASPATPAAAPTSADAKGAEELAKKSGCMTCHAIDNKVIGPAYKDVAAKYRGQSGAEAMLIEKVKKGGQGVWGQVPMPPQSPQVSDADIKTIVEWIMSLK